MGTGTLSKHPLQWFVIAGASWFLSSLLWLSLASWLAEATAFPALISLAVLLMAVFLVFLLLCLRFSLPEPFWFKLWLAGAPVLLTSTVLLPRVPLLVYFPTIIVSWLLLGVWGRVRFYPLHLDSRLHRARFSRLDELSQLLSPTPTERSLLLGVHHITRQFLLVRPTPTRRELGNLLIVAPTRGGKGLLAVSQLLSWGHSMIVNDVKGDLFTQTAGYRSKLGKVFVIDPAGVGHRYDPLLGHETEDAFVSAAAHLLYKPDEGDGAIFTQRAIVMLTQLFLAAKLAGYMPLPFVRQVVRVGLPDAAAWVNAVSPKLATQFLDVSFPQANFSDKFLLSAWSTLSTNMRYLLTETVVRCFTGSDFTPEELMQSDKPVTVYLRWSERDLLAQAPLVRLLWGSLINELITTYDTTEGKDCQPVLLLIDEAGRTAIPMLADQATTVVGRGISFWLAIQSLSQLETVYGRARAQVLRDNMETQLYARPTDLATAQHLETRLGQISAYAHSHTTRVDHDTSDGLSERPIPLLTAQEILQLRDEEIIGFHRRLPPFKAHRVDWRSHEAFRQKQRIPAPKLPRLPELTDLQAPLESTDPEHIDPDRYTN